MDDIINLILKSVFVDNMVYTYFLGMCSYLAVSKKLTTANGLGIAVIFVLTFTAPLNWLIQENILKEGALVKYFGEQYANVNLDFLQLLMFIAVIASFVQFVEMVIEKFSPTLYGSLGIFLPLITVNCSILGGSIFMIQKDLTLVEASAFGFGSGVGFYLAIVALAAIREKLKYSNVPKGLRGLGITFLLTGLLALAFKTFIGMSF
tara:strand:- start:2371 stop:2988 length:618 start_codon:yes stop_codon:yes gene_type:complete